MAQRPDIRARDIDRALTVTALDTAYAEGQLSVDEHFLRLGRARSAVTLADLRGLVGDLQQSVDLPEPPPRAGRTRVRVVWALAGVVVLVAGLIVYLTAGSDDAPAAGGVGSAGQVRAGEGVPAVPVGLSADVVPIVAQPFVLDTAAGLDDLRARYLDRFGSSIVLEVSIQPDEDNRADIYRDAGDGRRQRVMVSGGFDPQKDTDALEAGEFPFDWNTVDSGVVAGLIAGTPAAVNLPEGKVEYVAIDNSEGSPEISLSVYDADGNSGRVRADLAGNPLRVDPYRPR